MSRNGWNALSGLEETVMGFVWEHGSATAEDVRSGLADEHPMKDSTVRTILRRLEDKSYLAHDVEGRTYRYRPLNPGKNVAAEAVRKLVDRFCGGSMEELLVGMVDNEVIEGAELERLAKSIAGARKGTQKGKNGGKRS